MPPRPFVDLRTRPADVLVVVLVFRAEFHPDMVRQRVSFEQMTRQNNDYNYPLPPLSLPFSSPLSHSRRVDYSTLQKEIAY